MINFSNEDYTNIRARMLQNINADVDKRETSIADLSIAATSYELATIYELLDKIQQNAYILTASDIALDMICLSRGIGRKEATKSIKKASFNMPIPPETEFSTIGLDNALIYKTIDETTEETIYSINNLDYIAGLESARINFGYYYSTDISQWYKDGVPIEVTNVTELPEPSSETTDKYYFNTSDLTLYIGRAQTLYVTNAECETEGIIGNTYVGNVIPLQNIDGLTYANIGEVVITGTDLETDTSLRARFLATLGGESFAGNIASYRTYALSISGVGAVQVYPHYNGPGTVLLSILDVSYQPATPALIELVQNTICPPETGTNEPSPLGFGRAPIGAKVDVVTATNKAVNISMMVKLTQGTSISDVRPLIIAKLTDYIQTIKEAWGNALISNNVEYIVNVFNSRINREVSELEDVILSVSNIQINNLPVGEDLECEESNTIQELPILGDVNITEEP